jgi:hypothetical protein
MELKDILSISGQGGLFKNISQAKNGIIVENLQTGKRMHAFATTKISSLEDISIYTETDEVPLADVLRKIREKENGGQAIDHKSGNQDLKDYFEEVLPDYDKDRVYVSDIKKIISWYNQLQKLELLDFTTTADQEDEAEKENDK